MAINTAHDVVSTSPTNVFATLNPITSSFDRYGTGGYLAEGNLQIKTGDTSSDYWTGCSTIGIPLDKNLKFYWEFYTQHTGSGGYTLFVAGVQFDYFQSTSTSNLNSLGNNNIEIQEGPNSSYNDVYQVKVNGSTSSPGSTGNTDVQFTSLNTVGAFLIDTENSKLFFYIDGALKHEQTIPTELMAKGFAFPAFRDGGGTNGCIYTVNFGQDDSFSGLKSGTNSANDETGKGTFFYYPVDSSGNNITDFLALCTANLADPAIDQALDDLPEDYMKSVTYSGGSQSITVGFRPDLVWVKNRGSTFSHILSDSVRGDGNFLTTNGTGAEESDSSKFNQFESNGFSVGSHSGVSSSSQIAWCFRAGGSPSGSTSTTGSAKRINTSGTQDDTSCSALATAASATITPTLMSINTKAGFSIVKWLGNNTNNSTIPHGLTKEPDFVIIKNLTDSTIWLVKLNPDTISAVSNEQQYLYLHLTNGFGTNTGEETQITANTIKFVGTNLNASNGSGDYMIAYCWHSVAGYSAFGSYTGNGSADGPFVYTGFKPALIWIKCTSDSTITHTSWSIYDNAREPNNEMNKPLYANQSAPEGERGNGTTDATDIKIDFLSNGFRILTDKEELNDDGETYIFCCWAEMPFKYSATNAR